MNPDSSPVSEFKSKSGLRRIVTAFFYSIEGFKSAWRTEHAFRQELFFVIPGIIIALLLPVKPLEKVLLIGSLMAVLIVELLNSAVEAIVDRVSLERHPLSKNAKDFGSAAVTLAILLVVLTWGIIVFPLLQSLSH